MNPTRITATEIIRRNKERTAEFAEYFEGLSPEEKTQALDELERVFAGMFSGPELRDK